MKYKTLIFMALIVSLFLLSACVSDVPTDDEANSGIAPATEEQVEEQVSDSIEEELVAEDEEYVEIGEMI